MHQRRLRGPVLAALVTAILLLAASAAMASPSKTFSGNGTFGTTTCPTMSGPTFQQSGYCFYFPNGSSTAPSLCDPTFCGQVDFTFQSTGTFTATLTYPSPNGFNVLGLQLCQDGAAVPDPATCSQVMAPGGADVPGCTMDTTPGDNGTPLDPTDDTMTTTLTCPITATGNYTLIVYAISVLNCSDVMDPVCAADFTQGVTAALSGSFSTVLTSPGPEGASVEGGGEVAQHQHFSLHAQNDVSKWSKAHVRFAIDGSSPLKCSFAADGASFVDVEPDPLSKSGGTATVQGTGTVTDAAKVKHQVNYTLRVTDGGKGGTDTFALNAPGCDTSGLAVPVQHGNIEIHQHGDHH
jgi:hypothetical protein